MKYYSYIILFFILNLALVYASPYSDNSYGIINPVSTSTTNTITNNTIMNYSLNSNNSIYWQGHTGTDGSWLTGLPIYKNDTWAGNMSNYANYSNETTTFYLKTNPYSYYNITTAPIYKNDTWSGNQTNYYNKTQTDGNFSYYWRNGTGETRNFTTTGNITGNYIIGNGTTLSGVCLSNGTGCTSGMNYTNIALTNQSNNFNGNQSINGSLSISDSSGVYQTTFSGGLQITNNSYTLPQTLGYFGAGQSVQPFGTSYTSSINAISLATDGTYWICGEGGKIARSGNGTSWTQKNKLTYSWTAIYGYNSNLAWVGNSSGAIYKTTNGGTTWTAQTSGTTSQIYGIYFTDANNGWFVAGNAIYVTTNGGTSWASQYSTGSGTFRAIQMINSTNGYAGYFFPTGNALYSTTNSGATWSAVTGFTDTRISKNNAMSWINWTDGWILSGTLNTLRSTTNGGSSWTTWTQPSGLGGATSISAYDNNNVIGVGANGFLERRTDGNAFVRDFSASAGDINAVKMNGKYTGVLITNDGKASQINPNNAGYFYSNGAGTTIWYPSAFFFTTDLSGNFIMKLSEPVGVIADSNSKFVLSPELHQLFGGTSNLVEMDFSDIVDSGFPAMNGINDMSYLPAIDLNNRNLIGSDGATTALSWGDNQVTIGSANTGTYDNKVVCYVNSGELGHCTSIVGITGGCTCVAN